MYNSQIVAERIKKKASENNIALGNMFAELGISNNTLHNMKTSMPKSDTLARIADYLNVSVDYLLGRTDNPDGTGNNIGQSNIAGNNNASINNASPAPVHDSVTDEFMKIFKELSFEDKAELMHSAVQMKKKED